MRSHLCPIPVSKRVQNYAPTQHHKLKCWSLYSPWTLWFYLPVSWYFYLSYLNIIACPRKPFPTEISRSHTPVKEAILRVSENPEDCFQFTAEESAFKLSKVPQEVWQIPWQGYPVSSSPWIPAPSCPMQLVTLMPSVFISWAVDSLSEPGG